MGTILKQKLFKVIAKPVTNVANKITVMGSGNVGMAVALALLNRKLTNEIVFLVRGSDRSFGEAKDLQQASNLLHNTKISASKDMAATKNSKLCIITAGAPRKKGDTRLDLLKNNVNIMKELVPKVVQQSPDIILVLVTNPVEVMSYAAWKASKLPHHRVIGSGTTLDSYRFRSIIAETLGLSTAAVKATVIGEHGNSMVPCFSSARVGSARLSAIYPDFGQPNDPNKTYEIHEKTVKAGANVIALKGGTWWAIALTVSHLAHCILNNTNQVTPASTNVKGLYDIKEDLYMSLPCVLNLNGISSVVQQKLTDTEQENLQKSACVLLDAQKIVDDLWKQS